MRENENMSDTSNFPNFQLMWGDEVIASVHVGEYNVHIDRYDLNPVKQIFYKDDIPRFKFGEILRMRCWDERRPDMETLLSMLGLDEYNPYAICLKTHGRMVQDKTWFRFEGETLTYSELIHKKRST